MKREERVKEMTDSLRESFKDATSIEFSEGTEYYNIMVDLYRVTGKHPTEKQIATIERMRNIGITKGVRLTSISCAAANVIIQSSIRCIKSGTNFKLMLRMKDNGATTPTPPVEVNN